MKYYLDLECTTHPVQYPDRHVSPVVHATPPPEPIAIVVAARATMLFASRTSSDTTCVPSARFDTDTEAEVLSVPA